MENEKLEEIFHRENLAVPTLMRRSGAYMIDDLLVTMVVIALIWGSLVETLDNPEAMIATINASLLQIVLVRFLYQWLMVVFFGATLGKMAFKMRVVAVDTLDNLTHLQAILRSIVRVASEILLFLPFLVIFTDPFKRGLHDKIGKSVVVQLA